MKKQKISPLAQSIIDAMRVESDKNKYSIPTNRWFCLNTLLIIVEEADDPNNPNIYYDQDEDRLSIIVCDIPSLMKHGTAYDREGMRSQLLGLAERYKDDEGMYIVRVLITHDLNSCVIKNVNALLHQMLKKEEEF